MRIEAAMQQHVARPDVAVAGEGGFDELASEHDICIAFAVVMARRIVCGQALDADGDMAVVGGAGGHAGRSVAADRRGGMCRQSRRRKPDWHAACKSTNGEAKALQRA
jgi:hypothetical protein